MNWNDYRTKGREVLEYTADYLENIRQRRVFPDVQPGYMSAMIPRSPPQDGEQWDDIFKDVERAVMPGVTHWQSPYMHAYFPALVSPPSLLAEMIGNAINCVGFTWAACPAATELEIIVTDWLAQMLALPEYFLHNNAKNNGGGTILTTASEATLVSLLAARKQAIEKYRIDFDCEELSDSEINCRLVAYCSDQAHSSVEKACLISLVKLQLVKSDSQYSLRGPALREIIEKDIARGLYPFYVCATLGTTGSCAFDILTEVGPVCKEFSMWLHCDAAYAGSAFLCPEFRYLMKGIKYTDSFVFNASKWMMVHFDATCFWVRDSKKLHRTFNVEPLYLRHEKTGAAIDFMHWQIPLSKRFRALKVWFVIRSYGVKGLQQHIRKGVVLAQQFEEMLASDDRLELGSKRFLGLVTFRIKGDNFLTETLLRRINSSGLLHCVPASLAGQYIIRYTVTSQYTTREDIERDWSIIKSFTTSVIADLQGHVTKIPVTRSTSEGKDSGLSTSSESEILEEASKTAATISENDSSVSVVGDHNGCVIL